MNNKLYASAFLIFCILGLTSGRKKTTIAVVDLRCENLINPLAIDNTQPHLSWKITHTDGNTQQAFYQIQVASDSTALADKNLADRWDSGKTKSSSSVLVSYRGHPLKSRMHSYWRVRIWNEKNQISEWSTIQRFGIGIIGDDKLQGAFIGLQEVQSPLVQKKFQLSKVETTLIHVNALGYFELYINGKKVTADVLAPAVSHLDKRFLINTYDITNYLRTGNNAIVMWLGTGWFKPTTGFDVKFNGAVVRAQIDVFRNKEWHTILHTDSSWEGSPTGYSDSGTWRALSFGGERIDANLNPSTLTNKSMDNRIWLPVEEVDIPLHQASPQMVEPNRITQTLTAKNIKRLQDSVWLIDMGKATNGWLEVEFNGLRHKQELQLEYSDHLDKDGNFANQGQRDIYIATGTPKEIFQNKFNHHAFQYVRITNLATAPHLKDVKAHLIHTNFQNGSSFACSDTDLNAIHDMIQYTMRNISFSGYQVDCPHLERAGYGGDGNSSTNTFQTMYGASPLFANWVQAWSDAMREEGSLPHVAPNPGAGGGGPYWCGFFVMAPWRTHVNYGDARLITKYYEEMKSWVGYVDKYTVDGLLKRWPDTKYRDWFLGDWLAPIGVDAGNQISVDLVNNCFISECFATLEKIATVLGQTKDAAAFATRRSRLNTLLHKTFFNPSDYTYATGSQLDMSYPMLTGVTPPELVAVVKAKLLALTKERHNDHIAVGLVGVPILTQWAIENDVPDFMYNMLKKRDYPGYLHMIDNGATTTWEYWSGERSRIHNCYNGVGTWFYQAVAGIRPDENRPGYQHMTIKPQIPNGITWVKSHIDSPYGKIVVDWSIRERQLLLDIQLPVGSSATFIAPENTQIVMWNRKRAESKQTLELMNGKHTLVLERLP